jgi:hypothetical protein
MRLKSKFLTAMQCDESTAHLYAPQALAFCAVFLHIQHLPSSARHRNRQLGSTAQSHAAETDAAAVSLLVHHPRSLLQDRGLLQQRNSSGGCDWPDSNRPYFTVEPIDVGKRCRLPQTWHAIFFASTLRVPVALRDWSRVPTSLSWPDASQLMRAQSPDHPCIAPVQDSKRL